MIADLPTLLLTGADGFVGRTLARHLQQAGWRVRRASRRKPAEVSDPDCVTGLDLTKSEGWAAALEGVSTVVHAAALAHLPRRVQDRAEDLYWATNVDGTRRLAEMAAQQGATNFIFISSVAVNGNTSDGRSPFCETDPPAPQTIYGRSKAAAEEALLAIANSSGLSVTVIRPPMIYGPGAPGSFAKLTRAVKVGLPLPFGSISNQRAFVGVDNLASFVAHRAKPMPQSACDVFLIADDEQVSTTDFIRLIAEASDKSARLFPFPAALLGAGLDAVGLRDSLLGDLRIDTSKIRAMGWCPPDSLPDGLRRAVAPSRDN